MIISIGIYSINRPEVGYGRGGWISIYIYTLYIHICIHMYIYTDVYVYTHAHVYIHICTYIIGMCLLYTHRKYIHVFVYMYTHTFLQGVYYIPFQHLRHPSVSTQVSQYLISQRPLFKAGRGRGHQRLRPHWPTGGAHRHEGQHQPVPPCSGLGFLSGFFASQNRFGVFTWRGSFVGRPLVLGTF